MDELEHADQVGFDGICVNEHHSNGYGLMPSPNVMAGSLARRTRRASIVVMGNSVPLYNPVIRVARRWRCSTSSPEGVSSPVSRWAALRMRLTATAPTR